MLHWKIKVHIHVPILIQFKFVPFRNYWIGGYRNYKGMLGVRGLSLTQMPMQTTSQVNSEQVMSTATSSNISMPTITLAMILMGRSPTKMKMTTSASVTLRNVTERSTLELV